MGIEDLSRSASDPSRVLAGLFRLIENSSDLVAVFGPDLRHVYVNDAVCRFMQLPRERMLGHRHDELPMTRPNAERMQAAIASVFATGEPRRIEVRGRHRATGATTVWDISYDPERGPDGRVELVIGVSRDVSRLAAAEERARENAERLAILIDSAGVGIIGLDQRLEIGFVNRFAEVELRALCPGAPAIVGQPLSRFLPAELAPTVLAEMARVFRLGESIALERDFLVGEQRRRFAVQVRPERDEGEVRGVVIVARDVTREREREARLVSAERLAALGGIAAGVAHEISNPLSAIYGNLELVRDALRRLAHDRVELAPELAELREMLTDAHDGAERIRRIVDEFGLISRSDPSPVRADPQEVVEAVVSSLGPAVRARARLEVRLSAVPEVAGSVSRLSQALASLVQNALEALPQGRDAEENRVAIEVRRDAGDVVITVRDNGRGIPAEHLARVFDPFYTTHPVGQGMGLGLTLAHAIVTSLRGSLVLESVPDRGTVAIMRLPVPESPR